MSIFETLAKEAKNEYAKVVSETNNGKYKLLKWDRQERQYYPISINIHDRGDINE